MTVTTTGVVLFSNQCTNTIFWHILTFLGCFVANLGNCWCTFTGLDNAVVYQHRQIAGMEDDACHLCLDEGANVLLELLHLLQLDDLGGKRVGWFKRVVTASYCVRLFHICRFGLFSCAALMTLSSIVFVWMKTCISLPPGVQPSCSSLVSAQQAENSHRLPGKYGIFSNLSYDERFMMSL